MHTLTRSWRSTLVAVLLASMLAACGSDREESAPTGQGGDQEPAKSVKIGVIAPLSGSLTALGVGIRNSVELAIRQANEQNKIPGWRLVMDAQDDTAKPDVGAQVASRLASDQSVAGVVGTLNSSVALQVQPILNRENVVMVSPANTAIELTRGADLNNPKRQFDNYFRVCTNDAVQGAAAADFATKDLNAKNITTIHDKKAYGQGLVNEFTKRARANGATVTDPLTITPGDTDFRGVLATVKNRNPDLVYYGGEYPEASLLSNQAKTLVGIKAPLMGGDGIYDKTYINNAKEAAEGDLATSVGAPAERLPAAQSFIEAYNNANFTDPFSAYGTYSFDAANVIINALAKVLPGKDSITSDVRREVVREVQNTSFDGITGRVAFDQFGDTTSKVITVYRVQGGEWKPVKTEEFK